jgi:hypothetical protein
LFAGTGTAFFEPALQQHPLFRRQPRNPFQKRIVHKIVPEKGRQQHTAALPELGLFISQQKLNTALPTGFLTPNPNLEIIR